MAISGSAERLGLNMVVCPQIRAQAQILDDETREGRNLQTWRLQNDDIYLLPGLVVDTKVVNYCSLA